MGNLKLEDLVDAMVEGARLRLEDFNAEPKEVFGLSC